MTARWVGTEQGELTMRLWARLLARAIEQDDGDLGETTVDDVLDCLEEEGLDLDESES